MGRVATVKSESAASMAAVCPGSSTVPATVMIVVEYKLVYQLISRLQAAKVYSSGSTVPAAVVIVVKHRACLPVGRSQAYRHNQLVGRRRTGTTVIRFR